MKLCALQVKLRAIDPHAIAKHGEDNDENNDSERSEFDGEHEFRGEFNVPVRNQCGDDDHSAGEQRAARNRSWHAGDLRNEKVRVVSRRGRDAGDSESHGADVGPSRDDSHPTAETSISEGGQGACRGVLLGETVNAEKNERKCNQRDGKSDPGGVAALGDKEGKNNSKGAGGRHDAEGLRGIFDERKIVAAKAVHRLGRWRG